MILAGINGTVIALDRSTGMEMWRTELKGEDFVNVVVDDDSIYATNKGEIFCLDPPTGSVRWHNPLKGLGRGLVTIACASLSSDSQAVIMAEKRRREAAAAAAATSAAVG